MQQVALDIEICQNYLLILATNKSGEIVYEYSRGARKARLGRLNDLLGLEWLTWNGASFDLPLMSAVVAGVKAPGLLNMVRQIIEFNRPGWAVLDQMGIDMLRPAGHIDLMLVAPGPRIGLKTAGARAHAPTIRGLPYSPHAKLTAEQAAEVRQYCRNDLNLTWRLAEHMGDRIASRRAAGPRTLAMSDAMIGERAVREAGGQRRGEDDPTPEAATLTRIPWIRIDNPEVSAWADRMFGAPYPLTSHGRPQRMPDRLTVEMGGLGYDFGIGGIHTTERRVAEQCVHQVDVASYYPHLLLQLAPTPERAPRLCDVLAHQYRLRKLAQDRGDKATDAIAKIVINAASGKLASRYSCIYDPGAYLSMTVCGQLAIFMLAEMIVADGGRVISANTDGLVVDGGLDACREWEKISGLRLEYSALARYWARDVSTYLAVDADGKEKRKGAFAPTSLVKMPTGEIIADAAAALLRYRKSPSVTVREAAQAGDVRPFVIARRVTGGAEWRGAPLGGVARWVIARESVDSAALTVIGSGYQVPGGASVLPVMTLPERIPDGIDLDAYADKATALARSTGA